MARLTLGVLLSVVILVPSAQAAPAPDCAVPPTQCSPDGKTRIGFSAVTPAEVVDFWVPSGSYAVSGEYSLSVTAHNNVLYALTGQVGATLIEANNGGFDHYQAVFPSEDGLFDDPATELRIRYNTPGMANEGTFTVNLTVPAARFDCTVEGTKVLSGVCSFQARRDGLYVRNVLTVERKKKGKPWKPFRTVQSDTAFSTPGPHTASTEPLALKCKPGRKYRATATGELFTEAAGRLWSSDLATSERVKVKCKKK